jgi:hypothetical protein
LRFEKLALFDDAERLIELGLETSSGALAELGWKSKQRLEEKQAFLSN